MVCTLLPAAAFAADTAEKLYIADTVGGSATEVAKSANASGSGWSWNASSKVLTLNGFNGRTIKADGSLAIVLKGSNNLTLAKTDTYGILVGGKLTITKNSSDTTDKLTVTQSVAATSSNLIQTGANDEANACIINGGTVTVNNTAATSYGSGIAYWTKVNNAASLTVTSPYRGVGSVLETNTTGTVTVTTKGENAYACAAYSLKAKGTGTVTLNATAPAVAVFNGLTVASTAGNVALKGYVKAASAPLTSFSIAANKKVEASDSYYQGYYTTDPDGNPGYYLCSSDGTPLTSATYITDTDQSLTIMDSKLLDLSGLKVSTSYTSSVALKNATRGGAGSYTYSIKSGSALPAGLSIDASTGVISGKPTKACEAGSFVAVVTDKNGATANVTINYGSVKASEDKLVLNAGTASAISFSVSEDNSGTGWAYTAATKTLKLSSYSGGAIHCDTDLNIVLKGMNTITVPGSSTEGINVAGKLTIDKTTNSVSDVLTVKQTTTTTSANLIVTGGAGEAKSCQINGGNVTVTCSTGSKESVGFTNWVYVNNDASLTVTAPSYGVKGKLVTNTAGVVSVSSSGKSEKCAAVDSLEAVGAGAVTLSASANATTVYSNLTIGQDAGSVTLSGCTRVSEKPYTNYAIAPNKYITSTSNYIAGYYTSTDKNGAGYYLTNSNGEPLTSATIATKANPELCIMDSDLLDLPATTVGVKLSRNIYLVSVTRGGAGDYSYSIKSGSLPAGLTLGAKTGSISGTPTEKTEAGSFVVEVKDANGATDEVTINYGKVIYGTPDAPVIKSTNVASTGKIKVSWAAVDGAAKYKLYRATSKTGTYSCISTTTATAVTNVKNSTIGKCYYYYVVAIGYDGTTSPKSNITYRTVDCAAPTVTATNISSTGKIKVTWTEVEGASKYEVYRSTTSTTGYTKILTTTGTSLTNTSITAGVDYYYKVKAIATSTPAADSAYSSYICKTCRCAKPVVTAGNSTASGKITLKWNAVEGATKYYIYRSESQSGPYSYLTYTTKTSMTNTSSVAGKTYYYKVKAVCTDNTAANSVLSSIVSATCKCAQPVVTVTLSSGHPRLTWDKVDGAAKYEVYRATSKTGTYSKIYTTTATAMTNSGATAGTTYYYKVKAICTDNTVANSAFSSIVYIRAQ